MFDRPGFFTKDVLDSAGGPMELLAVLLAPPFMSVEADDPPCKASCWSPPWASGSADSAEGSSRPKPESSREPESPADSRDLPSSWFSSVLLRLTLLTKFENEPPAHAWAAVEAWALQAADTSNQGAWCTLGMLGAEHDAHLVLLPSRCRPQEKVPLLQQTHPQSLMHEGLMAHFRSDGSGLCSRA